MKISLIGYSGSGKSTLSRKLGEIYGCPVLHLDIVNFKAGWEERNLEESKDIVEKFMKNDSWIIDGNYNKFFQDKRMDESDKIIFMNFPRRICLIRACKRYLKYKNKVRESMAEGCYEKLDYEFLKWILIDGRSKRHKKHYENIVNKYNDKIIICKNSKDVESLLNL